MKIADKNNVHCTIKRENDDKSGKCYGGSEGV